MVQICEIKPLANQKYTLDVERAPAIVRNEQDGAKAAASAEGGWARGTGYGSGSGASSSKATWTAAVRRRDETVGDC